MRNGEGSFLHGSDRPMSAFGRSTPPCPAPLRALLYLRAAATVNALLLMLVLLLLLVAASPASSVSIRAMATSAVGRMLLAPGESVSP